MLRFPFNYVKPSWYVLVSDININIDPTRIPLQRRQTNVYNINELKRIAGSLGIYQSGFKDVLGRRILEHLLI